MNLAIRFNTHLVDICAISEHIQGRGNTLLQLYSSQSTLHMSHLNQSCEIKQCIDWYCISIFQIRKLRIWKTDLLNIIELLNERSHIKIKDMILYSVPILPSHFLKHIAIWHLEDALDLWLFLREILYWFFITVMKNMNHKVHAIIA